MSCWTNQNTSLTDVCRATVGEKHGPSERDVLFHPRGVTFSGSSRGMLVSDKATHGPFHAEHFVKTRNKTRKKPNKKILNPNPKKIVHAGLQWADNMGHLDVFPETSGKATHS